MRKLDWTNNPNPFYKYYRKRKKDSSGNWTGKIGYKPDYNTEDGNLNLIKGEWYYEIEPQWEEEWTPGYKGLDTAVVVGNASYPHISWNSYLNRFIMVTQGYNFCTNLFYSDEGKSERSLLNWHYWGQLPNTTGCAYPTLINETGDDHHEIGQVGFLFETKGNAGFFGTSNLDARFYRKGISFEKL
jgi:hypothetical protein